MIETSPAVYLIQRSASRSRHRRCSKGLGRTIGWRLVAYDEAPRGLLDLTTNKPALAAALGQLQYTMGAGQLNFFDSMAQVVDQIAAIQTRRRWCCCRPASIRRRARAGTRWWRKLRRQDDVLFPVALGGRCAPQSRIKKKKTPTSSGSATKPAHVSRNRPADLKRTGGDDRRARIFPGVGCGLRASLPTNRLRAAPPVRARNRPAARRRISHDRSCSCWMSDTSACAAADVKKPGQKIFARRATSLPRRSIQKPRATHSAPAASLEMPRSAVDVRLGPRTPYNRPRFGTSRRTHLKV